MGNAGLFPPEITRQTGRTASNEVDKHIAQAGVVVQPSRDLHAQAITPLSYTEAVVEQAFRAQAQIPLPYTEAVVARALRTRIVPVGYTEAVVEQVFRAQAQIPLSYTEAVVARALRTPISPVKYTEAVVEQALRQPFDYTAAAEAQAARWLAMAQFYADNDMLLLPDTAMIEAPAHN